MNPLSVFPSDYTGTKNAGRKAEQSMLVRQPSCGEERHCLILHPVFTVWKFTACNTSQRESNKGEQQ